MFKFFMKQISWLDLYYLNLEFQQLEGSRIETFYFEDSIFYIKTYVKQKGNIFLANKISEVIFLTKNKHTSANQPIGFITYLRKYLKNGIIQKIEQIPQERILKLEITKLIDEKIISYFLYIELFAGGNVILTNSESLILSTLENRIIKDVKVRAKQIYNLPQKNEMTLFLDDLNIDILKKSLSSYEDKIIKFIAVSFGIGQKYSEEVLFRLNIDKNKKSYELEEEEIKQIFDFSLKLKKFEINPVLYLEKEKVIDFFPFKFESINLNFKTFSSYNQVIEYFFNTNTKKIDNREKELQNEIKKLNNRLKKQLAQRKEIDLGIEKYNNIGNKIYENYSTVEELLNQINKTAKEKGWDYVEEKIRTTPQLQKLIKKLDYKNNKIILNLE